MYLTFAVLLLALAALSVAALPGPRPRGDAEVGGDRLRGFLWVGAVALIGWTVVVVVSGVLDDRSAQAEGLGMLGFYAYPLYLVGALLLVRLSRR